jgi:hypothetical protein
LGEFEPRVPKRNPFLYQFTDREIESRGKFPLRQTVYGRDILRFLELDSKINLGYIFLETGYTDASSNYGGRYETLRLRIKHPIPLKGRKVIPDCSVKFLQETEEGANPFQERRNHLRCGGLFWVKTDLSKVLPSEWFLGWKKS